MVVDFSSESCPPFEIILVPGGADPRREVDNDVPMRFLAERGRGCLLVTSVCTRACLVERAGLLAPLDGKPRPATTQRASLGRLRALRSIEVVEERYADSGHVITAAGVSAVIAKALYPTGRLWSDEAAQRMPKEIEYYPIPPCTLPETRVAAL